MEEEEDKGHIVQGQVLSPILDLLLVPEEDGFLSQWVMDQALREEDHALGEVVLGQRFAFLYLWAGT
ncbi:hypothetical protein J4Q44_G00336710 [Coregonus suidteri]|uniref:Uncharacterized protein n=1 Tax=Coregonus suidteri TaxID=861788 RepID=A0AAN8KQ84_9TELE